MKHLQKHYPQYPFTEKRYVIYCCKGDECALVQIFAACYAAKHFIDKLLEGDKIKRERTHELWTQSGIYVKCHHLDEILDHTLTASEKGWQLPEQYLSAIEIFKQSASEKSLVAIEDIASDLDLSARLVRATLQELGIQSRARGWSEAEAIKLAYKIRKHLKRGIK